VAVLAAPGERPSTGWLFAPVRHNVLLALLPFIIVAAVYFFASHQRLAENPQDKLLPSVAQMADAIERMALKPDPQTPVTPVLALTAANPGSSDHRSEPMILNRGSSVARSMRTRSIAPGAAR